MARGRNKIKSVDPFFRGVKRDVKGSRKVNTKPVAPDVQDVPKKMLELFKQIQLTKDGKMKKKTKKKPKEFSQFYRNPIDVVEGMPIFKRLPGEDDNNLLKRIGRISREVYEEFHINDKHDHRTEEEILDEAEKKDDAYNEDVRTEAKIESMTLKGKVPSKGKQKKRQTFRDKKKEKKRRKVENKKGDFDHLKDEVKFGEVCLRPPVLSSKPRKVQDSPSLDKPGKKDLLLKNIINPKEVDALKREINLTAGVAPSVVDLTVKRKMLTVADRRKLDEERESAIVAYRALKNRQRIRDKVEKKQKSEAHLVKKSLDDI